MPHPLILLQVTPFHVATEVIMGSHVYAAMTDYTPVERIITFQSSDSICKTVNTTDDQVLEDAEMFHIVLSMSDPAVLPGAISVANITILDDDGE